MRETITRRNAVWNRRKWFQIAMLMFVMCLSLAGAIPASAAGDESDIPQEAVHYEPVQIGGVPAPEGNYIVFMSTMEFSIKAKNCWDGTMEYSTNATEWNSIEGNPTGSATVKEMHAGETNGIYYLYIRGEGNTRVTTIEDEPSMSFYEIGWKYMGEANVGCYGNLENLLDYKKVKEGNHPQMGSYAFERMFADWNKLIQAPVLGTENVAERGYKYMFFNCINLKKPPQLAAKTLAVESFANMFEECIKLESAPDLSAITTLENSCYSYMFVNCKSLTKMPELPATVMKSHCYLGMFQGCTGLTKLPDLSRVTTLAEKCFMSMFEGCTGIKLSARQADEYTETWSIPDTEQNVNEYNNAFSDMFNQTGGTFKGTPQAGVPYYCPRPYTVTISSGMHGSIIQSLKKDNKLEFQVLPDTGYALKDITVRDETGEKISLTAIQEKVTYTMPVPDGDVTVAVEWEQVALDKPSYLVVSCDKPFVMRVVSPVWDGRMEYSQNGENWNVWRDGTITSSRNNSKYQLFLRGVGNQKVSNRINDWFLSFVEGEGNVSCEGNIENLLDYTTVAKGEHPQMQEGCFTNMFAHWRHLVQAPELGATTLSASCYESMFNGCTRLKKAPELPADQLAASCYESMFEGCTGLIEAPELPADQLAASCYGAMFNGCTSLTKAPELPAEELAASCYEAMFNGCTSLTKAPKLPAEELAASCYKVMFNGCTSLTDAPTFTITKCAYDACYKMFYNTGIQLSTQKEGTYWKPWSIQTGASSDEIPVDALDGMFGDAMEVIVNTQYYLSTPFYVTFYDGETGKQLEGSTVQTVTVGQTIEFPQLREAEQGETLRWYLDKDCTQEFDVDTPLTGEVTMDTDVRLYYKYDIHKLPEDDFSFNLVDVPYTGKAYEPEVTLKDGSSLVKGTDYDVTYSSNVEPGTAKVIVSGKGYYCKDSIEKTFKVSKLDPPVTWPEKLSAETGNTISTITFQDTCLKWKTPDTVITYGENKVVLVYTPTDVEHYNVLEQEVSVTGTDSEAPEGTLSLDGETTNWSVLKDQVTFDTYFNTAKKFVVSAQDKKSGVDSVKYYVANEPVVSWDKVDDSVWKDYDQEKGIVLETDQNYVIYVQITDLAGNKLLISSDGFVVDTTAPQVEGITDGAEYKDQSVVFTVSDEHLQKVTVNGQVNETSKKSVKYELSEPGSYEIEAVDMANNVSTWTVTLTKTPVQEPTSEEKPTENPSVEKPTEEKPTENPSVEKPTEEKSNEASTTENPSVEKPTDNPTSGQTENTPVVNPSNEQGTGNTQPATQPSEQGTGTTQPAAQPSEQGTGTTQPAAQPSGQGTGTTQPAAQPSGQGTGTTQPAAQPNGQGTGTTQPATQSSEQGTGNTQTTESPKSTEAATTEKAKPGEIVQDDKGWSFEVLEQGKGISVDSASVGKDSKTVKIPNEVTISGVVYKVTEIKENAFANNENLKTVIIGKNVETIGASAFENCKNLKTVTVGKNVKKIGKKAFANCKNLKKIVLDKNVTSIGEKAFSGDKKLVKIEIKSTKLKSVAKNAFKGIKAKIEITVPKKQLAKYSKLFAGKKNIKLKAAK